MSKEGELVEMGIGGELGEGLSRPDAVERELGRRIEELEKVVEVQNEANVRSFRMYRAELRELRVVVEGLEKWRKG